MKRLKVVLLIVFMFIILSLVSLANEVNNKRKSFFDSPFFNDSTLQSAIEQFESRMNDLSSFQNSLFKTEWTQDDKGRTIYINPSDKNLKMDIKIENGMIQIKSTQEKNADNMRSQSVSTQMMSIPQDCDANASQISQMDDGVKIFFPFSDKPKSISKERQPDRIPIKPSDDSVDI